MTAGETYTLHEKSAPPGYLIAGAKYTIHEKKTPAGYKTSDDVSFTTPTEEPPYKVTFYNVQVPDDVPKTGDRLPLTLLVGIAAAAIVVVGATLWFKERQ